MYKQEMAAPSILRQLNREGKRFLETSFGACPGYLQLNMALISDKHASDFDEFCQKNSSACPLIFKSKPGQVEAPPLTKTSDIRSDLAGYKVYKDGEHTDTVKDITDHPWKNMVSFYLGCSFSFDDKLVEAGIQLKKLGIYKSNIACHPAGVFSTDMVVSMRGVPKGLLSTAVEATINVDFAHGAPIHIGRPQDIGVASTEESDMGFPVTLEDDEVPVFWACGITSSLAIRSAKLPICFSHSPGCMFVSDILSADVPKICNTKQYPKPRAVCLDETYSRYGILSEDAWAILDKLENEIHEDPGNRGIQHLIVDEDFHKACLSLSKSSHHVGIVLGFPCLEAFNPSEENDGVHGAVYLAKVLMHLGKQVTFIVDDQSGLLKSTLLECFSKGFLSSKPNVISVGPSLSMNDTHVVFDDASKSVIFSHLISIERPSPSDDGTYRTMSARDISNRCDPIDVIFEQAKSFPGIVTIGIGDGGNEVGMGKVREKVIQHIPNGDVICAATSCDYLITCGVSDWGGIAIACGLFALRNCPVHDRFQRNGIGFRNEQLDIDMFVPNNSEDEELHKFVTQQGFRDGMSKELALTVDNLDYYKVHAPKLRKCRELATT